MFRKNYLAQVGRNMIEMLAVLGVIAVLTIGGLFGYNYGMRLHRANKILDDVNSFNFIAEEGLDHMPDGDIDKKDFVPESGFEIIGTNESKEERYHIDVPGIPKPLCQVLVKKAEENYVFLVNKVFYEGNVELCDKEENVVYFYFGNTDRVCNLCDYSEGEDCCDGCVCSAGTTCMSEEHPTANSKKLCCPSGKINCGGRCVDETCPSGLVRSTKTCQCDCEDEMKTQKIQENGSVVCQCMPEDGETTPLNEVNGECVCPNGSVYSGKPGKGKCCPPSSIYVPGQGCREFSCPNGEGGWCYIDGGLCGIYCSGTDSSQTVSCQFFQCRADECTNGYASVFGRVPHGKSSAGGFSWGCLINGHSDCIEFGTSGNYIYCFNGLGRDVFPSECCKSDTSGTCIEGSCKPNICEQFKEIDLDPGVTYVSSGYVNYRLGGCRFSNGVECWPTGTDTTKGDVKWTCIPRSNEDPCVTGCDMGVRKCWESCSACGENGTPIDGYCCYYHTGEKKVICRKGSDFFFKESTGYSICGSICTIEKGTGTTTVNGMALSNITDISCNAGHCQNPNCPSGWEYAETTTTSGWWGCVKKTDPKIECFQTGTGYGYECFEPGLYLSSECGGNCDRTKSEVTCSVWWRKACAPIATDEKPYCAYGQRLIHEGETETETMYDCNCKSNNIVEYGNEKYCCPEGHTYRGGDKCVLKDFLDGLSSE